MLSLQVLLLLCLVVKYASILFQFELEAQWYTRYPNYPNYCSTKEQMEEQSIPPLKASGIDSNLLHVTAIFCHGA